jgi:hypothetical protein
VPFTPVSERDCYLNTGLPAAALGDAGGGTPLPAGGGAEQLNVNRGTEAAEKGTPFPLAECS